MTLLIWAVGLLRGDSSLRVPQRGVLSDSPSLLSSLEPLKPFVAEIKMLAEVPLGQTVAVLYSNVHMGIY